MKAKGCLFSSQNSKEKNPWQHSVPLNPWFEGVYLWGTNLPRSEDTISSHPTAVFSWVVLATGDEIYTK